MKQAQQSDQHHRNSFTSQVLKRSLSYHQKTTCRADDFWQHMQPALSEHGRDPQAVPPGASFISAIHTRLEREQDSVNTISMPKYWMWSGWLAAAAVLAFAFLRSPTIEVDHQALVVGYNEDGFAMMLPVDYQNEWRHGDFYSAQLSPFHGAEHISDIGVVPNNETHRPWLGVVTKKISLKGIEQIEVDQGLLLVRITSGSPADQAGLKPGDVLLNFADCPMKSRYCIAKALRSQNLAAGDQAILEYWRPGDDDVQSIALTLSSQAE